MNKKSVEKYKQARRKGEQPEISEAEHRANCDAVVEMLFSVAERIPPDSPPVAESMDELMAQLRTGVKSPPVVVERFDGRRLKYYDDGVIEILDSSPIADATSSVSGENAPQVAPDSLQPPEIGESAAALAARVRDKKFKSKF
jgi:hypothetical protein